MIPKIILWFYVSLQRKKAFTCLWRQYIVKMCLQHVRKGSKTLQTYSYSNLLRIHSEPCLCTCCFGTFLEMFHCPINSHLPLFVVVVTSIIQTRIDGTVEHFYIYIKMRPSIYIFVQQHHSYWDSDVIWVGVEYSSVF